MMLLQKGAAINIKVHIRAPKAAEPKEDYKPAWNFNPLGKKHESEDREYPLFQVHPGHYL